MEPRMIQGGATALLACLAACSSGAADWRGPVIARAEEAIRGIVQDPHAGFTRVQVTGDNKTGQTCGYLTAPRPGGVAATERFIVYIDNTAGPFIEPGLIDTDMSQQDFENAWQADCVREGYAG